MTKQEFLMRLRKGLSGLPQEEVEERLSYYEEMAEDRMEDGLSEEEAIAQIGNPEDIARQIIADTPLPKLVKEKIKPKKGIKGWELALLLLGSPIWLSVLIAIAATVFAVYAALWAVIVALWAVEVGLCGGVIGGLASGIWFIYTGGSTLTGLVVAGVAIACAGLAIFMFFGYKAVTKGMLVLTAKLSGRLKRRIIGKGAAA